MKHLPLLWGKGLFALIATTLILPTANAEFAEYKGDNVQIRIPFHDKDSKEAVVRYILKAGTQQLKDLLLDVAESNAYPDILSTVSDIEAVDLYEDKILRITEELSEWAEEQRDKKGGELTQNDFWPDAIVLFGGGKFSKKLLGITKGGSGLVGVIIMLQKVYEIDKFTGETKEFVTSVDLAVTVWPSFDLGLDTSKPGISPESRFGAAFVWDNKDQMQDAHDFYGGGFSGSTTTRFPTLGKSLVKNSRELWTRLLGYSMQNGVNLKYGFLFNGKGSSLSERSSPDYTFISASTGIKPVGNENSVKNWEMGTHINFTIALSPQNLVSGTLKAFAAAEKAMQSNIQEGLEEEFGARKKKKRRDSGNTTKPTPQPRKRTSGVVNPLAK